MCIFKCWLFCLNTDIRKDLSYFSIYFFIPGDITGAVALVNDQGRNWYGRVQVYYNDTWGTVCDNLWSLNEAKVVCTSLGFDDVDKWMLNADAGEGPIWLDNIQCDGTESSLVYCTHAGWGVHSCDHTRDVAISCYSTYAQTSTLSC